MLELHERVTQRVWSSLGTYLEGQLHLGNEYESTAISHMSGPTLVVG